MHTESVSRVSRQEGPQACLSASAASGNQRTILGRYSMKIGDNSAVGKKGLTWKVVDHRAVDVRVR